MDAPYSVGQNYAPGGGWPGPDNYNANFTSLSDYNNWINAQLAKIPTDFSTYQKWIQNPANQVIISDIADAAGFLIRNGSTYTSTELQIENAALALETSQPNESDYNQLISGMNGLWPEPDNYDAGWNTPDQYMNFINSLNIPQNDPDFQSWIQSHRQELADLLDAAKKLVNTYSSPYSDFLNNMINDVNNLSSGNVTETDLNIVSQDVQYYDYNKGFTTDQQYEDFLKNLYSSLPTGTDPSNYQQWVENNPVLLRVMQDAANRLQQDGNTDAPWNMIINDIQTLQGPYATGSTLGWLATTLQYIGNIQFHDKDDAYSYLQGLWNQIPVGDSPQQMEAWLQNDSNREMLQNILIGANYLVSNYGDPDGSLQKIISDVENLEATNASPSSLNALSEDLRFLRW
jgi:hypothetical protein